MTVEYSTCTINEINQSDFQPSIYFLNKSLENVFKKKRLLILCTYKNVLLH